MNLELISFPLCPFVQRSMVTLLHKGVDFRVTYIDLDNKPEWFLEISPTGKVPVLRVESTVLFESAVINEYIDEVTEPRLHPADPLTRASHRAWIEYGSSLLVDQFNLMLARDSEGLNAMAERFFKRLQMLESQLVGPFFQGPDFSLVDAAFAPLFQRLEIMQRLHPSLGWTDLPRLQAWSQALLALSAVQQSVPQDFDAQFAAYLRRKGSCLI
ncbi:glutathione S-transferase family protein [Thermithiobacillus plumbiphilus]|uniref:glutathione transferase n=1 Tax=Thermithiobacillus plumbiphilus TaxID=1729899 RepID=A0ABU9DAZ4_9PROT